MSSFDSMGGHGPAGVFFIQCVLMLMVYGLDIYFLFPWLLVMNPHTCSGLQPVARLNKGL
jgi:NADH:ubiquinone oxidoreductase subunit 3 (subunit A)